MGRESWLAAAQAAMARVLPVPGGPTSAVSGPRAPSAMSRSTRGRGTDHPGRLGTVILYLRMEASWFPWALAPPAERIPVLMAMGHTPVPHGERPGTVHSV